MSTSFDAMDRLCGTSSMPTHHWHPPPQLTSSDLRVPGEILQLILNELDFPAPFTAISKRYYEFSRDPYVRAQYFLAHYGRTQALYWALGSGRLMNERVIDVCASPDPHPLCWPLEPSR